MKDLLFLPIEIEISQMMFTVDKSAQPTFKGLWQTKELNEEEIISSGINKITNQLPYEKITLAKYNTQSSVIPSHVDVQSNWTKTLEEYEHIKSNEPAGYRVVLIGNQNSLEVFDGVEWKTARLPQIPFAYVLNSTKCQHRVVNEPGRQSLYFRGFLNKEKHQTLIEKNLKKFKDFAICSQ
jgi:hypothetical protein